jgi:hypothetical protein
MKTNEVVNPDTALAASPVPQLLAGLGDQTLPVSVPAAGFKLQQITIRKPRTFAVRIRFSR